MSQSINAAAQGASVIRNKKRFTLEKREAFAGWMFLLPTLIGFSIFTFFSIGFSFWISLTRWDLLTPPVFIGFRNYINIFHDATFIQCLWNTLFYVIMYIPLALVVSMALAIALNQKGLHCTSVFKASAYLPYVTSTIAIGMVWFWIYNADNGLLNTILRDIGIAYPPRWLESTVWSKPALVIMKAWSSVGYYMILFLTGLQTIPQNLYEAAEVDGASKWQRTRYITIPMLSKTTFFVIIMLIIGSFSIFEAIYIMTKGGPAGSTNSIMYYIYDRGFQLYKMGYAAALSWILFAMMFGLTLINNFLHKDNEK